MKCFQLHFGMYLAGSMAVVSQINSSAMPCNLLQLQVYCAYDG